MSKVGHLLLCAAICISASSRAAEACDSVDYLPSVVSTIKSFGFPAETYNVTTSDGYKLILSRIPDINHKKNTTSKRPAILLMHGLAQNGATFMLNREKSLPFLLAKRGFDVWLGSTRGGFGTSHVSLSNKSEEFWDFSWHENGVYDVPALISYIKNVTGQSRIQYVGHSMGTTMFFVMCSMLPRQCEQDLLGAYLLAPVTYLGHSKGIFKPLGDFVETPVIFETLGALDDGLLHGGFQVSSTEFRKIVVPLCSNAVAWRLCLDVVEAIAGVGEPGSVGKQAIKDVFCFAMDNMSWKQLMHYAQNIVKDNFRQYTYKNPLKNLIKYGTLFTAPRYPLEDISIPLSLYYGTTDPFVEPSDLLDAVARLPTIQRLRKAKAKKFSHVDFIFGKDAPSLVYEPMINDAMEDVWDAL